MTGDAPNSAPSTGSAGRYMSMETGANAVTAPRTTINSLRAREGFTSVAGTLIHNVQQRTATWQATKVFKKAFACRYKKSLNAVGSMRRE